MDPTFFCPVCGEPSLRLDTTGRHDFSCRKCDAAVELRVYAATTTYRVYARRWWYS